jgi:hypothetical protein
VKFDGRWQCLRLDKNIYPDPMGSNINPTRTVSISIGYVVQVAMSPAIEFVPCGDRVLAFEATETIEWVSWGRQAV